MVLRSAGAPLYQDKFSGHGSNRAAVGSSARQKERRAAHRHSTAQWRAEQGSAAHHHVQFSLCFYDSLVVASRFFDSIL